MTAHDGAWPGLDRVTLQLPGRSTSSNDVACLPARGVSVIFSDGAAVDEPKSA